MEDLMQHLLQQLHLVHQQGLDQDQLHLQGLDQGQGLVRECSVPVSVTVPKAMVNVTVTVPAQCRVLLMAVLLALPESAQQKVESALKTWNRSAPREWEEHDLPRVGCLTARRDVNVLLTFC